MAKGGRSKGAAPAQPQRPRRRLPRLRRGLSPALALFVGLLLGGWLLAGERAPTQSTREPVAAGTPRPKPAAKPSSGLTDCKALYVFDGDSLEVECARIRHRVRLLNVDAPERGEAGADRAREALRRLSRGRLRLEFEDAREPSYGRYGRLLAYVFDERGQHVNLELVRAGAARYLTDFGPGRFAADFRGAESDARVASRGLWAN